MYFGDLLFRRGGKTLQNHADYNPVDTAAVSLSSAADDVNFFAQTFECHQCSMLKVGRLKNGQLYQFLIDTRWPIRMEFSNPHGQSCNFSYHFNEHGNYSCNVASDSSSTSNLRCQVEELSYGVNSYLALYVLLSCLLTFFLACVVWQSIVRRLTRPSSSSLPCPEDSQSDEPIIVSESSSGSARILSVDAFRGICLFLMIFVNYGGGKYWFFVHSKWNGLTLADLVFPWFVFVMGSSMAISFEKLRRQGVAKQTMVWQMLRRTCTLCFLGIVISNSKSSLAALRLPGVLQRLALSYLIVSLLEIFLSKPTIIQVYHVSYHIPLHQWLPALILPLTHVIVTLYASVPGCPTGYTGPGGLDNHSMAVNCTGGAAGYLDRQVLFASHLYAHPTSKYIYHNIQPFDPEGILGLLTSAFLCFTGLQAGKCIAFAKSLKLKWLSLWCCSILMTILTLLLCGSVKNDGIVPVNKNLWSVSFVFCSSATAIFLLWILHMCIDVSNYWSGYPFHILGRNSILIYMCHEVFAHYFPVQFSVMDSHAAQLALHVYGAIFWLIVALVLAQKKIYLTI